MVNEHQNKIKNTEKKIHEFQQRGTGFSQSKTSQKHKSQRSKENDKP